MPAFNTGDVVSYKGSSKFWKQKEEHIIHEVSYIGKGRFEYSTNRGAWFVARDFLLIRRADKESFKQLDKDLRDEGML